MFGDTSRVDGFWLAEPSWATLPTTSTFQTGRFRRFDLEDMANYAPSQEIRSDRQRPNYPLVSNHGQGTLDFELSYGTFDDWLLAALMDDAWSDTVDYTASTIAAVASPDSFTSSVSGGGFPASDLSVGQWIYVTGFTETANNGWHQLTSVSATTLGVASSLTAEAEGDSVTIKGSMIRNGTTGWSFALEREHDDLTQFFSAQGHRVNTLSLSLVAEQIITGSIQTIGKAPARAAATIGDTAATAVTTTDVMTASVNVGTLQINNATLSTVIKEIQININLNARTQFGIGSTDPQGIGQGANEVTGRLSAYFEDGTMYDYFKNQTSVELFVPVSDAAGNRYGITLPNLKVTNGKVLVPGQNQDVMAGFDLAAIRHAGTATQIQIDRIAA